MGTDEPACESSPVWWYPSRSKNARFSGRARRTPSLTWRRPLAAARDSTAATRRTAEPAAAECGEDGQAPEVDVIGVRPVEHARHDPAVALADQDAAQLHEVADGCGVEGERA